LLNWVKQLSIKHFRGVFSRDSLPERIKRKECGIVNLDSHIGAGTHWVCYRNIDRFCEYFDSFGLAMPKEVKRYMQGSGKQLVFSGDEIHAGERFRSMWLLVSILSSGEAEREEYSRNHT